MGFRLGAERVGESNDLWASGIQWDAMRGGSSSPSWGMRVIIYIYMRWVTVEPHERAAKANQLLLNTSKTILVYASHYMELNWIANKKLRRLAPLAGGRPYVRAGNQSSCCLNKKTCNQLIKTMKWNEWMNEWKAMKWDGDRRWEQTPTRKPATQTNGAHLVLKLSFTFGSGRSLGDRFIWATFCIYEFAPTKKTNLMHCGQLSVTCTQGWVLVPLVWLGETRERERECVSPRHHCSYSSFCWARDVAASSDVAASRSGPRGRPPFRCSTKGHQYRSLFYTGILNGHSSRGMIDLIHGLIYLRYFDGCFEPHLSQRMSFLPNDAQVSSHLISWEVIFLWVA